MIRKATEEDLDKIIFLDLNSDHIFYKKNPNFKKGVPKWMKEKFNEKNKEVYVYEKKNTIIGAAFLKKSFSVYNSCEIDYLAVLKSEQGQGIGKKLIEFIEKKAQELGFERIFIYTGLDNLKAHRFYEKNNYKKINEFPGYYSWGDTAVLFGKKLK
ncbi:MAG: GNAT family N-acetyltransferase [Nanoarchaeota archaeon]|nr:GNAT family N-acetyltransferase [Nanoarchaeota archaeon]MBU1622331.1 GNAT family N-acetyltransferase [Nanoarchaeota archaeon]MBU1974112.1 GNAT family N-acetyltransferase [Nanoarchaeota archaeon]